MALVCDIKSDNVQPLPQPERPTEDSSETLPAPDPVASNEDLEDGEIEDDEDEEQVTREVAPQEQTPAPEAATTTPLAAINANTTPTNNKFNHVGNKGRFERHNNRYEERKRSHLTEAEKSVMHLHKLERMERNEREKRDRYKREPAPIIDDFASTVEKAIASVLKKDKKGDDDEKEEEDKRGKKRKKKEKDKKKVKQRKMTSPKSEEYDETEMMNIRKGSPEGIKIQPKDRSGSLTPRSDYDSYESSSSSDRSRDDRKEWKKEQGKTPRSKTRERVRGNKKNRDKNKDQKTDTSLIDTQEPVCLFYLQGKCTKGDECPYSHEVAIPMKLELCKFYLMDCCAKRDKCLYMHSEFPCKFYHTGLRCQAGDTCKFAHGRPLNEGLKQILYKHIETAPKEILGDFPRLTRDGALNMINQTQKTLEVKYGDKKEMMGGVGDRNAIPSLFELNIPVPTELLSKDGESDKKIVDKNDKSSGRDRNKPSRWQEAESSMDNTAFPEQQNVSMTFGLKGFYSERGDQDMRITSNGDVDMRTLPPLTQLPAENSLKIDLNQYMRDAGVAMHDIDIRTRLYDVDSRQIDFAKDIDIRQIPQFESMDDNDNAADEPNLEIVLDEAPQEVEKVVELPATLPKKQRELFLRIQSQQKENLPQNEKDDSDEDKNNIDWYSDDDDDDYRLTIKDDIEESKVAEEIVEPLIPPPIKPVEVLEKLGDLSKIDISEEVTKLLSTISQVGILKEVKAEPPKDPRMVSHMVDVPKDANVSSDPRRARVSSTETKKVEKMSIYEQGSISIENASKDVDLRTIDRDMDLRPTFGDTDLRAGSGRSDIDLRQLGLPFKAIQNYTPASEIDASINSHGPMVWRVHLVDIPRPDYTGLKLSAHDAQQTGDPRLCKIFKVTVDEKESPASPPKESPQQAAAAPVVARTDPRRRREEKPSDNVLSYAQQLNMLQTSVFYQSLTSNQKVLLNQELSTKTDHSGCSDPTLNGILSSLGLIPAPTTGGLIPNSNNIGNANALTILASVNNMMGPPSLVVPNQQYVTQQMNPNILAHNPNMVNQMVPPGLLSSAPPVQTDFQLNFDPRQGGLLGNAPVINYNDNGNYNYNEDYYEGGNFNDCMERGGGGMMGGRGRGGRGGFRGDRPPRRGRNFNNRNSGGRNFRNRNRNNRSRTPP